MTKKIIQVSNRGTITIPNALRKEIKTVYLQAYMKNGKLILEPLQTKEQFFDELEEAEKDWEKNGGISLEAIKKKYKL